MEGGPPRGEQPGLFVPPPSYPSTNSRDMEGPHVTAAVLSGMGSGQLGSPGPARLQSYPLVGALSGTMSHSGLSRTASGNPRSAPGLDDIDPETQVAVAPRKLDWGTQDAGEGGRRVGCVCFPGRMEAGSLRRCCGLRVVLFSVCCVERVQHLTDS